jgi:hypothetical protein
MPPEKMYFSERKRIAEEAIEYLKKITNDDYEPNLEAFNIVTALSALGYLKRKEERA